MQMLRLIVKEVIGIVYCITYLRKDLLKEQALQVLKSKYYSLNNFRVGCLARYYKDLVLEE
jgi:cytidine deaminase